MGPSHVHPFCVQVVSNATDIGHTARLPIVQNTVWASLEVGPAVPGLACISAELPCSQDTQNGAQEHDTASGKLPVARLRTSLSPCEVISPSSSVLVRLVVSISINYANELMS